MTSYSSVDSWIILNAFEQRIKEKIEAIGIPLKKWNINIYRGILTGYNEAFIIDGKKKDELISQDPKSAEIIRPILRGRDIKRYSYDFANLYIIITFPSLNIDIENYPAVKEHLLNYKYDRLKQTGEPGARKKTNNKWFETQDSISYWDDFSKQKIVWGEISDRTKFSIDINGDYLTEATTFLMTGNNLIYLLGVLNSKLSEYMFSKIGTTTGVGTIRWKKFTIEQLPVFQPTNKRLQVYEEIIFKMIKVTHKGNEYESLEKELNQMIYDDFNLSKEEIAIIEK